MGQKKNPERRNLRAGFGGARSASRIGPKKTTIYHNVIRYGGSYMFFSEIWNALQNDTEQRHWPVHGTEKNS
jgi:hypothetical protein